MDWGLHLVLGSHDRQYPSYRFFLRRQDLSYVPFRMAFGCKFFQT
jgi:hypothetical protein